MNDSLEELEARHKRELKELQGKIQSIKKAVPKGELLLCTVRNKFQELFINGDFV